MRPVVSALLRGDCGGLGTLSRLFHHGLGFHRTLTTFRIPGERGAFCSEDTDTNRVVGPGMSVEDIHWLCQGATHVMSFEVWYDGDKVPRLARQMGVKTVLVPNYECLVPDHPALRETDIVISPTGLDLQAACDETPGLANARHVMVPIPCDIERIPFHQRDRAEVFIHRAGHQGEGRNGTIEILKAWQFVKSPARLIVFYQGELPIAPPNDSRIECRKTNPPNYWDQYADGEGDVMLHPTRHDALSLPIQEALTAGMPVIAADWWPHCDTKYGETLLLREGYLPSWSKAHAIPVMYTVKHRMCREFTSHRVSPQTVAEMVDRVYGEDISIASREAREWAEGRSWDKLRGAWLEALK